MGASHSIKNVVFFGAFTVLCACASDPVYTVPSEQSVSDYVAAAQLEEVDLIRKGDRDSWQYVNDRYVIYRGRGDDFLLQFKGECVRLTDNSELPPADFIHDHRHLRASDTFRGCIVAKVYSISDEQRTELRNLGEAPPGIRNLTN